MQPSLYLLKSAFVTFQESLSTASHLHVLRAKRSQETVIARIRCYITTLLHNLLNILQDAYPWEQMQSVAECLQTMG